MIRLINGLKTSNAVLLALLALGCSREDASVATVPKETTQGRLAPADAAHAHAAAPAAEQTVIQWTLPAGWFERQGDAMRAGSFSVTNASGKSADISIIPLAGTGGGDLGNVNRWRGQIGLPPVKEADLPALWQKVQIGEADGRLAELFSPAGTNPSAPRMLAAVMARGETSWFFKMTGDDALVAAQKPSFVAFLKSVRFEPGTAALPMGGSNALPAGHPPLPGAMPAGHPPLEGAAPAAGALPAGHPPLNTAAPTAAAAAPAPQTDGAPLPSGWTRQSPKAMQSARYTVAGEGAEADISVTELGGDGGGPLANVNRWRGQIGLDSFSPDEYAKAAGTLDVAGTKAILVDMTNDARKLRLVAIIVTRGEKSVFYKMTGAPALVGAQKAALIQFVQSAK